MRALFSFGFVLLVMAGAAPAQIGVQANALGGGFASRGMSHPLGGFGPVENRSGRSRRGGVAALPYAYSFYVPNYFDDLSTYPPSPGYAPPAYAPAPIAQPAPPSVVINQYFGGPGPVDQTQANDTNSPGSSNAPAANHPAAAGDPLSATNNYYLIAYKDHSIYAALTYWVEGGTLHYVTTQNTHNQASLKLIDLELTKTLNEGRNVPFSIPGQQAP